LVKIDGKEKTMKKFLVMAILGGLVSMSLQAMNQGGAQAYEFYVPNGVKTGDFNTVEEWVQEIAQKKENLTDFDIFYLVYVDALKGWYASANNLSTFDTALQQWNKYFDAVFVVDNPLYDSNIWQEMEKKRLAINQQRGAKGQFGGGSSSKKLPQPKKFFSRLTGYDEASLLHRGWQFRSKLNPLKGRVAPVGRTQLFNSTCVLKEGEIEATQLYLVNGKRSDDAFSKVFSFKDFLSNYNVVSGFDVNELHNKRYGVATLEHHESRGWFYSDFYLYLKTISLRDKTLNKSKIINFDKDNGLVTHELGRVSPQQKWNRKAAWIGGGLTGVLALGLLAKSKGYL